MPSPAPALLDQDADPAFAELLSLRPLFDGPAVALPHAGLSLPLRLSPAPPGSLRARLRWLGEGAPAGEEVLDLGVPAAAEGGARIRIEPDMLPPAGRYDLAIRIENSAGEGLARLMLPVEVTEFGTPPPAWRPDPALLRRRSLGDLPDVPLAATPPAAEARIEQRGGLPQLRAAWDHGDLERLAASGVPRKPLIRVDQGPPLSVSLLHDATLLAPGLLITTPRGVVEESQLGVHPEMRAAVAAAIDALPRSPPRRTDTVALALPLHPAAPDPRRLDGFNHYHLHTEHLCALLQIEALRRAWPGEQIETLLPACDALQAEARALLAANLGAARSIGAEDIRAARLLLPNRCLHHKAPDPLVAEVFARIRRNVLARPDACQGGPRVYVARFGAAARLMHNEAALAAALAARGFELFDARRLRYRGQVLALAGARVIVGAHGAGLTNMGFAAPGALLVECFSPFFYSQCFQQLAAIAGHRYRAFRQAPVAPAHPQAPWDLDIPAFLDFLDPILDAEPA